MAKKFRDLVAQKPASWRAAVDQRKQELLAAMPLNELRRARQLSQEQLAEELGATQPEISKIEHRTDMYVSTLRRFVEAMGGQLEIIARFPDGTVEISQFHELDPATK
jgi:transcriptional regulator with XRE-family HTH domain